MPSLSLVIPLKNGTTSATSAKTWSASYVGWSYPSFCIISVTITPSGFVPGNGSAALFTLWTLLSVFVKVPSFSKNVVPGKTTSANFAVSLIKISWTTNKSKDSIALITWALFGSVWTISSPIIHRPLTSLFIAASKISGIFNPAFVGWTTPYFSV